MELGERHVWLVRGFRRLEWHHKYFLNYNDAVDYYLHLSSWYRQLGAVVIFNKKVPCI